jgi:hypothetical protein
MRHRSVIAVSFLDGAAVAAALLFGLSPHSTPTSATHHVAVAQAAPPSTPATVPVTPLLAEETRVREARHAAKVSKTLNTHEREARRAAAKLSKAQKSSERQARRTDAQNRAAERRAAAKAPRPTPEPKVSKQRQTRDSNPKHGSGSHAESRAQRRLAREQRQEKREREHAQREAAHQQRREERQIAAAERQIAAAERQGLS